MCLHAHDFKSQQDLAIQLVQGVKLSAADLVVMPSLQMAPLWPPCTTAMTTLVALLQASWTCIVQQQASTLLGFSRA